MAKKNQKRGASRQTQPQTETTTQPQTAAETASHTEDTNMAEEQNEQAIDGMVTLTKRNVQKNGIVTYARDGVNASVYFNKSMFNGEPPDSVSIGAVNLRQPGEGGIGGGRTVSPEKLAERAKKADELAEKAKVRAEKALAKANKLKARIGGTQAPAAEEAAEEVETV